MLPSFPIPHFNLMSFDFIWFCFTFQHRLFMALIVPHLDGIAGLPSPTWWIISCTARCKTIWWTLLPPAQPKHFIILSPFTRGSRSCRDSEENERFHWFHLFFFPFSLISKYISWALSEPVGSPGLNLAAEIRGQHPCERPLHCRLSKWLQKGHRESIYFLSHLFTIRPQRAPSGWMSLVYGVLRNPWRTLVLQKPFSSLADMQLAESRASP